MKYILMFVDEGANWDPKDPQVQQMSGKIGQWFEEHSKSGKIVGGEELKPAATATTVRTRGGEVTVTDGPFIESKESIGGFAILNVKDLDEAIAIAKGWPTGAPVEIRPLVVHE